MAKIKKMSNARQVFDSDYRLAALLSQSQLTRTTNRKTGTTARGWTIPKKLGDSEYRVDNQVKTTDGKHFIVRILDEGRAAVYPKDEGRAAVYPKKAKLLYIPLSQKGKAKRTGAKIPAGLVFGVDYVLAKSAKAFKGTGFIKKAKAEAARDITRRVIKTIRKNHGD